MVLAMLIALAATPALAAETLQPPYPDIWGRELPGVARFFTPMDDDIVTAFSVTQPDQKFEAGEFWLEGFFGGHRRQSSFAEFEALYHAAANSAQGLGTFSNSGRIGFADGSAITVEELVRHRDDRWTCDVPVPAMVKRNAAGKVLWRKIMVRLLNRPVQAKADGNCKDAGQPYTIKVEFWSLTYNELYGLADGPFLARFNGVADYDANLGDARGSGGDRRFVIRFDAELGSPFLSMLTDVIVADAALLGPVIADAVKHPQRNAAAGRSHFHDRVYETLRKLKRAAGP
jgi:hypothetical protein